MFKINRKYLFVLPAVVLFFIFASGAFYLSNSKINISPELSFYSRSFYGKSGVKSVAASCGAYNQGHAPEDYKTCTTTINCNGTPVTKNGTNLCGLGCVPNDYNCGVLTPSCPNGATNYPTCTTPSCPYGPDNTVACGCKNFATNPPTCTQLPICPNGATNYPNCDNKVDTICLATTTTVLVGSTCVCKNGATNPPFCTSCPAGKIFLDAECVDPIPCTTTDICNQPVNGYKDRNGICVYVLANARCTTNNACGTPFAGWQCPGGCTATPNNNDCITTFNVDPTSINPDGYVDFSWKTKPGVGAKCGFVDLTTNIPRPIPGLQNLDTTVDRARISNIQVTTRFCLVCQFYNLTNNAPFGEAALHRWIRVIRIGEG